MATSTNPKLIQKKDKRLALQPPATASAPLAFYCVGKYEAKDGSSNTLQKFLKIQKHNAEPSVAAKLSERNPTSPDADLNVKPTLHDKFNHKLYHPGRYLNPYGCQRSRFKNIPSLVEKVRQPDSIQVDHLGRARIAYGLKRGVKSLNNGTPTRKMPSKSTGEVPHLQTERGGQASGNQEKTKIDAGQQSQTFSNLSME